MFHVNSTYMCNEFEVHVYKTQPSVLKERYTHAFTSFPYLYKIPKIKNFREFIIHTIQDMFVFQVDADALYITTGSKSTGLYK